MLRKTLPVLLATTLAVGLHAQSNCVVIVPDATDGVIVAPQNHKVLYENVDVRVLEVTVAPHTIEPMHTHARPAIFYLDHPGTTSMHFAGTDKVSSHVFKPDFKPIVVPLPPETLHAVENSGETPFHAIRVELKHPGCSLSADTPIIAPGPNDAVRIYPEGHRILFENGDVRVLDVVNPPHSKEPFHTHLWPGFFYVVQGEPMRYSSQDGTPPLMLGVPPVKVIPLPPNPMHSVENLGDEDAHFIRFELKHATPGATSAKH